MGLGSAFEKISGAAATLPNAAGFDKDGNLYVADTGIGGAAFTPPVNVAGGVWMMQAKDRGETRLFVSPLRVCAAAFPE